MKITKETASYNQRRYGRPWIAKVDCANKPGGKFIWGIWIGDARNGGEGELILDGLNAGDIYATGQKDMRQPRNSAPSYFVVDTAGDSIPCSSIVEAKKEAAEIKSAQPIPAAAIFEYCI